MSRMFRGTSALAAAVLAVLRPAPFRADARSDAGRHPGASASMSAPTGRRWCAARSSPLPQGPVRGTRPARQHEPAPDPVADRRAAGGAVDLVPPWGNLFIELLKGNRPGLPDHPIGDLGVPRLPAEPGDLPDGRDLHLVLFLLPGGRPRHHLDDARPGALACRRGSRARPGLREGGAMDWGLGLHLRDPSRGLGQAALVTIQATIPRVPHGDHAGAGCWRFGRMAKVRLGLVSRSGRSSSSCARPPS